MGLISDIKSLAHEPYNYARRHSHLRKKQFDPYRKAADFTGIPQSVSDAYWSATHPIDRIRGRGRASGETVMVGGHPMRMQVGMVQPSGGMLSGLSSGAKMKIFNIRKGFQERTPGGWRDYVHKNELVDYMPGRVIDEQSLSDMHGDPTGIAAFTDEHPHGGRISRVIPPHLKAPKHVQEMLDKGELAYADEAPGSVSEMDKVLQDAEDAYWKNRSGIDLGTGKEILSDSDPAVRQAEAMAKRWSKVPKGGKQGKFYGPHRTPWPTLEQAQHHWYEHIHAKEPYRIGTKTFQPTGLKQGGFSQRDINLRQTLHDVDLAKYIREDGAPHRQWARKIKLKGSPMQREYWRMEGKAIREDALQRDQNFWAENPHWGPDLDAEPGDFDFDWANRVHEDDIQENMHNLADRLDPATRYDEGARVARNQSRRYGHSEGMFGVHYEEGTNWWRPMHGDHSVNPTSPIGKAIEKRLKKDPRWQGQHRQATQENAIRRMPMAFGKKYEYASRDTAVPKRLAKKEILKRRWISGQRGG